MDTDTGRERFSINRLPSYTNQNVLILDQNTAPCKTGKCDSLCALLFPGIRATSRKKLAELLIDHSPEYKRRADAKKEHLAILADSVETWNDWRRRNPTIRPTLYKAELSQRALSYVDFSYAD
jgi:hypothetical protein